MIEATKSVVISDEELRSFTSSIHQRHGIDFSCYEPQSLKYKIVQSLPAFNVESVHELWAIILKEYILIFPFMNEISGGLTSMFRDPVLWNEVLTLLKRKFYQYPELAIWHAGCSTGEEVYTMSIVLRESGYSGKTKTRATDISKQALETAKSGIYPKTKLEEYKKNYSRYNPAGTLTTYFAKDNHDESLDTNLINHVEFQYHNLITSPFVETYDIIFCCNVMIYFDNRAKQKLLDKFYQSLNEGGILVVGFYDVALPLIDESKFELVDLNTNIFRKVTYK